MKGKDLHFTFGSLMSNRYSKYHKHPDKNVSWDQPGVWYSNYMEMYTVNDPSNLPTGALVRIVKKQLPQDHKSIIENI